MVSSVRNSNFFISGIWEIITIFVVVVFHKVFQQVYFNWLIQSQLHTFVFSTIVLEIILQASISADLNKSANLLALKLN